MRRLLAALCVPGLLAGALTACGEADEARSALTVRVLVRDINIRPEGVECAGTGPYTHFHNRAPFQVVDADGRTLATGALSSGTAVPTFEEDLEVARVPTYCEFDVPVTVAERDAYGLVVDGHPPITLTPNSSQGPALVAVVPS
ncbi:hypothetical protein Q2K19_28610 [Micromonospora soli]|uniref:hypothetical protein n=1 Tax=Micromonospora sp. NBRC 110009 TaxID=3061627 RepID=UPI0026716525|nr:hypothetical protein [Micromonospora sp. NBRC 110009]WKT98088.1 hypothetical protein Q2K19_28610 [Micromonospora sp. NBRC 110009]